jgi:enoyl-CoA hydratase
VPDQPEILFERRGVAGLVTLNRPQALNAVTLGMVRAFTRQLRDWLTDPSVTRVVLSAAGGRAFSAGGDIRALYQAGTTGRHDEMLAFYGEEYVLNSTIKHYPKPMIALIDGIVMGGGVGLSVHGSHRVAGDRLLFAMPEVGIGFFPDVGATWFLPRLPGEYGAYCALTGERLGPADAMAASIATHRVSSARFGELADVLCGAAPVDAILGAFAEPAGEAPIAVRRNAGDRLFKGNRVEDILSALDASCRRWFRCGFRRNNGGRHRTKSPTSLKFALAQMRRRRPVIQRVHADRIPHSVAHRSRP